MNTPQIGDAAPDFDLPDRTGTNYSLASFNSLFIVLYFYPKDGTPGCTVEAQEFSKDFSRFAKLGATIVGISGGTSRTKEKFCVKYDLKVLLLSDPSFEVAAAYDSYGEKKFMGRTFMGIHRKTFVLDRERKIVGVFDKVNPKVHSEEVLTFLKGLKK